MYSDIRTIDKPDQIGNVHQIVYPGVSRFAPIYGVRIKYLPSRDAFYQQVEIKCFGDYAWINVDPERVYIFPRCGVITGKFT